MGLNGAKQHSPHSFFIRSKLSNGKLIIALSAHREIIDGRIASMMVETVLTTFPNIGAAVRCPIEVGSTQRLHLSVELGWGREWSTGVHHEQGELLQVG